MIRRWTLIAALVTTLTVPATALAQGAPIADASASVAGNDEVSLTNGGMIRGTVIASEPNKEVTILVPGTTAPRRIPWADVANVSRGKYTAAPFPAAPLPVPVAAVVDPTPVLPPPVPGELGAPHLHIDSPSLVTLHETFDTDAGRVRPIDCVSPCDRVIDGRAGQAFFFAGDEIPQSARFHMTEKSGNVTAHVSPGNASLRSAGVAMLVLGITSAVAGAIVLPVGMAVGLDDTPATHGHPASTSSTIPIAGGVTLGLGTAMTVAGVVMNVVGHTRYDFSTSAAIPGGFRF